jgi:Flp pilus assembly protein TadD
LNRLQEAVSCLDRLLALRPDDPSLHTKKAQLLTNLGREQEAT